MEFLYIFILEFGFEVVFGVYVCMYWICFLDVYLILVNFDIFFGGFIVLIEGRVELGVERICM